MHSRSTAYALDWNAVFYTTKLTISSNYFIFTSWAHRPRTQRRLTCTESNDVRTLTQSTNGLFGFLSFMVRGRGYVARPSNFALSQRLRSTKEWFVIWFRFDLDVLMCCCFECVVHPASAVREVRAILSFCQQNPFKNTQLTRLALTLSDTEKYRNNYAAWIACFGGCHRTAESATYPYCVPANVAG